MEYKTDAPTSQEKLKKSWGVFLGGLADWDWYATLTFRDRPKEDQDRGWTKIGTHYAARAFRTFIKAVQKKSKEKVHWVNGLEYQRWRGVPHYHALVKGVQGVRRLDFVDWWFNRYGIARILPYNAAEGASYYISKYVTKELGEINFSKGLTSPVSYVTKQKEREHACSENEQRDLGLYYGDLDRDRGACLDRDGQTSSGEDENCQRQ